MAKVLKRTVWGGDFWLLYKRPFQYRNGLLYADHHIDYSVVVTSWTVNMVVV